MKRCGWCKQRVWPWQRARTYGRHTLHVRCSKIIYQLTLRQGRGVVKYAVTIEGGWLQIIEARDRRSAEHRARREWNEMQGRNVYPEVHARPATDDDIAWHRAMGGHG